MPTNSIFQKSNISPIVVVNLVKIKSMKTFKKIYLDKKAKQLNANFEASDQEGIIYRFPR
ncbi:hypothetical protein MEO39_00435 [Dolichospermum sp. ST_sed2]|nr:hypothetical protein [Dolichospermum sp. ST_sed8]MDD1458574.1 hypothetical protein [Dolichospermum sp. ST_sed2]MDD1470021.1 hypothetical protein [Dolichospermum sp. ST_sed4]